MIACIIPARLNSSRFPRKLLTLAAQKTVLQHTYEVALRVPFDALFVATDSQEIANHVHQFGGTVLWTSPHCTSGTERIAEAIQNEPLLQKASLVINLQGDHPLTSPITLKQIVQLLIDHPSLSIATAVRPLRNWEEYYSPHAVKCVFDHSFNALYFSRSPIPFQKQGNTPPFGYLHIGIYGYRLPLLQQLSSLPNSDLQTREDLEQLKLLEMGIDIKVALVEDEALGIDTPEDLEKLKKILCRKI
jgi:3-deoxy-manno-octulosonate cytidylyltransferase (CMP-KDO synthetase)